MIYTLSKIGLLAFYAAVAASFFGALPLSDEIVHWMRVGTALLLATHALELVVFRKHVARYSGPLAVSMVLTLLFGLLHWMPLARSRS